MTKFNLILLFFIIQIVFILSEPKKLEGTVISTSISNANLTNKWTGFEFSTPYIFTKVTWEKSSETSKLLLGVFEGANNPSFMDGIPLNIIKNNNLELYELDIEVKLSFKYIRYVSSDNSTLISSFTIYGYEPSELDININPFQVTKIPLISIHTKKPFEKASFSTPKNEIKCNIVIINNGKIEVNSKGKVRFRGNSSLMQPKKSYQINFDTETQLLDMPSISRKWGLLANYLDKTLLRNLVAFKISSLLGQKYTPQCKSVDLIFNGVYEGTYIICDKVEVGKNRVELGENDEKNDDGFLMEIKMRWGKTDNHGFISDKNIPIEIKYPDEPNNEQLNNLKYWFNNIERDAYNYNITDLIDLESFSQYFILQEFTADIDCVWGSYFITKHFNDEKLYFGPGWDYDLALDNDKRLYPTNEKTKWTFNIGDSAGSLRNFISKLMSIPQVLDSVQSKWKEVTMYNFSPDILINYVNEQIELINESQKLNFQKWKILDKIVQYTAAARGSYEAEVSCLKSFLEERFVVFGKRLLESNTSSFKVDVEKHWWGWDN